jgi:hypothetical protein
VNPRRIGCLTFGIAWILVFGATFVAFVMGDPTPVDCAGVPNCDPYPKRWTDYLLLVEFGVLVVGAALFWRAGMKDSEF